MDHFEEEPNHELNDRGSVSIVLYGRVIFAFSGCNGLRLIRVEVADFKFKSLLKLGNYALLLLVPGLEVPLEDLHSF